MSLFSEVFSWVGDKASFLWHLVAPATKDAIKAFFNTFEGAAMDAIKAEATKAITGQEKLANAVTTVEAIAIKAGWQASQTALLTLVQDVYLSYKAASGQSIVVPPVG